MPGSEHPGSGAAPHGWISSRPSGRARRLDVLAPQPALRGIRHLITRRADKLDPARPCSRASPCGGARASCWSFPVSSRDHLGTCRSWRDASRADHRDRPPRKPPLATERWRLVGNCSAGRPSSRTSAQGIGPEHDARVARLDRSDHRTQPSRSQSMLRARRLMCGSDWPVSRLNGDYAKVWRETVAAITVVRRDAAARRILETRRPPLPHRRGAVRRVTTPERPVVALMTRRSQRSRI